MSGPKLDSEISDPEVWKTLEVDLAHEKKSELAMQSQAEFSESEQLYSF